MTRPTGELPRGTTGKARAVHYIIRDGDRWVPICQARTTYPLKPTQREANCRFCLADPAATAG